MTVLVTAASKHGSTAEIARAIAVALAGAGVPVTVQPPEQVGSIGDYEAVVLGSAVYAGHWLPEALALVDRGAGAWLERPVWLFSSGPVGDPTKAFTRRMAAEPVDLSHVRTATHAREHRLFPGKLDPKSLPAVQRAMLTVFRGMRGDYRDWTAIKAWAAQIADALHQTPAR